MKMTLSKDLIGFGILGYSSALLLLVFYLSHYTLEPANSSSAAPESSTPIALSKEDKVQHTTLPSAQVKQGPHLVKKKPHQYGNPKKIGLSDFRAVFEYDTSESKQRRPIPEFHKIKNVKKKKLAFTQFFKEIIDEQNAIQLKRREQLLALKQITQSKQELSNQALGVYTQLLSIYRVPKELSMQDALAELDSRINVIPGSMILAQAASESAWGTSRFAREAKNFFGQWCFKKGCGIIPSKRAQNAKHEIARFKSAESSVRAYFKNLNTYRTYKEFRKLRMLKHKNKKTLKGIELIEGLKNYSERGGEYILDLKKIIRFNKFNRLFSE